MFYWSQLMKLPIMSRKCAGKDNYRHYHVNKHGNDRDAE